MCGSCRSVVSLFGDNRAAEAGILKNLALAGIDVSSFDPRSSHPAGVKNVPLVNLVVTLIVVGVALWLINRFIPMASSIKSILNVVVVLVVVVWLLQAVGLWSGISSFRVGR
jgi:hypothetical protein